jgi:tetratricopeptide (TPR) repeat protein
MRTAVLMMIVVLAGILPGCSIFRKGPVVPEMMTASEQARVADDQLRLAQRTPDEDARRKELKKASAAFQQVVTRFPDDTTYTPAAYLILGDIHYRLEDYKNAERYYRTVVREYPNIADVHAGALYGLGETLTAAGNGRAGKEYYRQMLDIYAETDNPLIRERMAIAKRRYDQVLDE